VPDDTKYVLLEQPDFGKWRRYAEIGARSVADDVVTKIWHELMTLRARAAELGVEVDEKWTAGRLREEIAKAGGDG
jgi:hypothetical protein